MCYIGYKEVKKQYERGARDDKKDKEYFEMDFFYILFYGSISVWISHLLSHILWCWCVSDAITKDRGYMGKVNGR